MTIKWILSALGACFLSLALAPETCAKPPSEETMILVIPLGKLASKIESGGVPNEADVKLTDQALASADDLTVASALGCLRELGIVTANAKVESLGLDKQKIGPLSSAIMGLIQEESKMASLPMKGQIEKLNSLTYSNQPYLNIEAAKRLAQYDIEKAKAALQRIASDKESERVSAEVLLRKIAQKQGEPFTPKLVEYENPYSDFEHFTGHLGEARWLNKIKPVEKKKVAPEDAGNENQQSKIRQEMQSKAGNDNSHHLSLSDQDNSSNVWLLSGVLAVVAFGICWRMLVKRH